MVDTRVPTDHNKLVIMSGGTIDSHPYESTPDRVSPLEVSIVPDMVRELGYGDECDFFQWIMKDSQDFTPDEIRELAGIIRDDTRETYIVTHGTDAMPKNASLVKELLAGSGKTVLFVGAMEPLMHGKTSDGPDTLKYALEHIDAIHENEPGVYIIGRGEMAKGKYGPRRFDPDEAVKDREHKIFRPKEEYGAGHGGWAR